MNGELLFSSSFFFRTFTYNKYRHNDIQSGAPSHYIALMLSGSAELKTEDGTVEIRAGDAFYIPMGCRYQSFWYGDPTVKFISLGFLFMPSFDAKVYDVGSFACDESERELFKKIAKAGRVSCSVIGDFYTLLGMIMPKITPAEKSRSAKLVRTAKKLLAEAPHMSVTTLARKCSVSRSTLFSAFEKHSDESIGEYKNSILMEKAKGLLIATDLSIEEISEKLSFSSSSYFRKRFLAYFGMPPRNIRKRYNM